MKEREQILQVIGIRTQRVRGEPSIGEMTQEPAGRTNRLPDPIHEFDAANDATITLLDHPYHGILRPCPHSTGQAQRLPSNDHPKVSR